MSKSDAKAPEHFVVVKDVLTPSPLKPSRIRAKPYESVPAATSLISLASTSTPLADEDHTRPRTARSFPVTFTAAPAASRAPSSRAPSPAITTPSLKGSRPSPQSTSTLITGIPVGVVRTSGAAITRPTSSILFRLTRGIRFRLGADFLRLFGYGLLRYLGLARRLFGSDIGD